MFFQRILERLPPLPRQHLAAIGCTKITSQWMWLYTRIASKALKVSYSDVGEGGVAVKVNCEKTQFFLNTLYLLMFVSGPFMARSSRMRTLSCSTSVQELSPWLMQVWPILIISDKYHSPCIYVPEFRNILFYSQNQTWRVGPPKSDCFFSSNFWEEYYEITEFKNL